MKEMVNIQDVHRLLFGALCHYDDFCREHGLRYFLANGTLLGAAKYGAFVPWDDDADVLMPRKDYDKLVRLWDINTDEYRLLCREQTEAFRMPYAKLSCERTRVEEGDYDFGVPLGLSLDIFPLDAWSDCRTTACVQSIVADCRKRMLICSIGGEFATSKTGVRRRILQAIDKAGKKKGYAQLRKTITAAALRGGRRGRFVGPRVWTSRRTAEVLPADIFSQADSLSLCGRAFPVPVGYCRYLDRLYGNWQAELPLDEQRSNHEIKVWWRDAE